MNRKIKINGKIKSTEEYSPTNFNSIKTTFTTFEERILSYYRSLPTMGNCRSSPPPSASARSRSKVTYRNQIPRNRQSLSEKETPPATSSQATDDDSTSVATLEADMKELENKLMAPQRLQQSGPSGDMKEGRSAMVEEKNDDADVPAHSGSALRSALCFDITTWF